MSIVREEIKHPVLIVRNSELNYIRSPGFWVISCNTVVRSYILKCVTCRHLKNFQQQTMVYLLSNMLCEKPSFIYSGVNLFEPFVSKEDCKEPKRYGALFKCLSSKAINIEIVTSLNTDAFILC